jgi:flagella basal body P-ring formation protein FlgA
MPSMKQLLLPIAPLLLAFPARAESFADPAGIDAAVAAFSGAEIGQSGGATLPVDRRLRLAACRQALALAWNGARRDSVVVSCPDAGSWRIFVPVVAAAPAVAAVPAVARGEAVTIEASGEGFSVSQPGEALEAGPVGAWIRVRPAGKGEPLRARIVRPGLVSLPVR